MKILSSRSNFLASELEKKSSQMKEIMEVAEDHATRNNAAMKVIESLMRQVRTWFLRMHCYLMNV